MGIFKPELQIEKTVTAVVKAGESEQIQVTENNKPMVRAGDTIIYTIQVSNLGNYKATNVVVTDSLDVIFDGKTVPANQELAKIETLDAGKVATLKVGYIVKQADIDAVLETEQNEIISKDIINIATATDGKTTVEDDTSKVYLPSISVTVPFAVPFSITFAPIIGSPFSSFTIPLTVFLFCDTLGCKTNSVDKITFLSTTEYFTFVPEKI